MSKQFNRDGVPVELLEIPQWVCWRWAEVDGRRTKIPMVAATGSNGSSTNPATWTSSSLAESSPHGDGIGFVVTPRDAYCGIDIDHCIADGAIHPYAKKIVDRFDSYTEITVSGTGLRVWVKAKLPRRHNRINLPNGIGLEFYDQARFFTVTGDHLPGTPMAILDRQDAIDAAYARYFPPDPPRPPRQAAVLSLSDLDMLTKARAAKNGDAFDRLWQGDTSGHGGDDSAADLALCCHLAFWTGRDPVQMDRLFRQSGLYREKKWDRHGDSYANRTITKAIEMTPEVYTPGVPLHREGRSQVVSVPASAKGLFRVRDFADEIRDYYHHGAQQGQHPGWDSLAHLYRVGMREWTVVTGAPTSGKSAFLDAMILKLIDVGWKFVICSPENQPLRRHFAHLSAILVNQPFYGPERMDEDTMEWAINFLDEHVIFNKPPDITLDAVLEESDRAIREFGANGIVIDPWNRIERARPKGMSETDFTGECLTRITNFIRDREAHLWLVAHPTKLTKERRFACDGKPMMKEGRVVMDYPPATLYDISGSSNFFNMADNGFSVYRDKHGEQNKVQVHVLKVKFYENGKAGVAELRYQTKSRRFEDTGIWWEDGCEPQVDSLDTSLGRPDYTDPEALSDSRQPSQMGLENPNTARAATETSEPARSPGKFAAVFERAEEAKQADHDLPVTWDDDEPEEAAF